MDRDDVENLGGGGTEGKPGDPAGGTEPQLPRPPLPHADDLFDEARRRLRKEGTLDEVARMVPPPPPRTGVGAFDEHAEPAGMGLGGDTGDVSVPHMGRDDARDTHGASATPDASTVMPTPREEEDRHAA
jgi:hypothetical protein